jgi:hypothetical protein
VLDVTEVRRRHGVTVEDLKPFEGHLKPQVESREQRAESREQIVEREQRTESREQIVEREQRTESREQRAGTRG